MRKFYWYISTFFRKHGVILLTSIIGAVIIFSVFLPFAVQKLNFKHRRYPTSNVPEPIGNSFSKSYSVAQGRGHKYMAIKRDCIETSGCTENGGEMLSFNQLNHINKVEYSYGLPSIDQKNKLTGCSLEVCKEKFDIEKEIWAVYQLYE
jgi:hypothetical protein